MDRTPTVGNRRIRVGFEQACVPEALEGRRRARRGTRGRPRLEGSSASAFSARASASAPMARADPTWASPSIAAESGSIMVEAIHLSAADSRHGRWPRRRGCASPRPAWRRRPERAGRGRAAASSGWSAALSPGLAHQGRRAARLRCSPSCWAQSQPRGSHFSESALVTDNAPMTPPCTPTEDAWPES